MDLPSELSLNEIRKFMLKSGGKVTNHELVKYFKNFLTNPDTKGIEISCFEYIRAVFYQLRIVFFFNIK